MPAPFRTSGRRQYDNSALQRLAIIKFAKHVGLSLVQIRALLDGSHVRPPVDRWRRFAHEKMKELDSVIADASALKGLLEDTLRDSCPKLIERASTLQNEAQRVSITRVSAAHLRLKNNRSS